MTLHTIPPPASPVIRVARGGNGPPTDPFAPPDWERAGVDGTFGNRFDDPGTGDGVSDAARFRVVYTATERAGAFAETIAHFRPDLEALAALAAITGGMGEHQAIAGVVSERWRRVRGVGRMLLDPALRFADVAHPDTLAELRTVFARLATDFGHPDIDLSTVTSGDRRLTQRVARYIYERGIATGMPTFAGVRYISRHGAAWECWAIFADRLIGEQLPVQAIGADDAGLVTAARHFGLTIQPDTQQSPPPSS